jgi:HSP20 family molecular chaperone IbpA
MTARRFPLFLAFLIALATLLTACAREGAPASVSPSASKSGSARAVGLRVKLELLQKLGADALRIDVEAEGGRVVLAGEVEKRATAELAEEVARKVEGVVSVASEIEVAGAGESEPVDRALAEAEHELTDAALEVRARIALVDRLGSDGFRIGTDAASGVLTLEFPKSMPGARRREAVRVAKRVEGVQRVVSLERD